MLEVVRFDNGRYGIRNTWTGVILTTDEGKIRAYRSKRRAFRVAGRLERGLLRTMRSAVTRLEGAVR